MQKAAQKITSILDLDQLIDSVVNEVTASFGCVEASIFLHDEERGEMVMAGGARLHLHAKGHRLKIGQEGMVGHVAATGQMRYAPDVRKDQVLHRLRTRHALGSCDSAARGRAAGGRLYCVASGAGCISLASS